MQPFTSVLEKNVLLILSWTNDSLILSKINNGKNDSVDL